jgi:hypothetical protein
MKNLKISSPLLGLILVVVFLGGLQAFMAYRVKQMAAELAEMKVQKAALDYVNEQRAMKVEALKKAEVELSDLMVKRFKDGVDFYASLNAIMSKNKMEKPLVVPISMDQGVVAAKVDVTGSYNSLLLFLGDMRQGPKGLRVDSLSVSAASKDQVKVSMSVSGLLEVTSGDR